VLKKHFLSKLKWKSFVTIWVFTLTFDQFNAFLLNNNNNTKLSYKKNLTDHKLLNSLVCTGVSNTWQERKTQSCFAHQNKRLLGCDHLFDITAVIGAVDDAVGRNIDSSRDPCDLQSAMTDHGKLQTERRRQWDWNKQTDERKKRGNEQKIEGEVCISMWFLQDVIQFGSARDDTSELEVGISSQFSVLVVIPIWYIFVNCSFQQTVSKWFFYVNHQRSSLQKSVQHLCP